MDRPRLRRDVRSASARTVGIEKVSEAGRRTGNNQSTRVAGCRRLQRKAKRKADDVVKAAGKILAAQRDAIVPKLLLDADAPGLARFRLERRIAKVAEFIVVQLIESRLLDSLSVKRAQPRLAPEAPPLQQHQRRAGARHHSRAKVSIGFGTCAEAQRRSRMRCVAKIEIAALIVAADMAGGQKWN